MSEHPIPLLPLRHGVVLPGRVTTIPVGRARSRALAESLRNGDHVLLAVQRDAAEENPSLADLHPIATYAKIRDKTERGNKGVVLVVEPLERWHIRQIV